MNRRKFRENIVKILYLYDLLRSGEEDAYESMDISTTTELVDFSREVISKLPDIDQIIQDNLENWKLSRLNFVDRAIIRLATYELRFTDTPKEICINEALEITKKYTDLGDSKSKNFNNKLLDNIAKTEMM